MRQIRCFAVLLSVLLLALAVPCCAGAETLDEKQERVLQLEKRMQTLSLQIQLTELNIELGSGEGVTASTLQVVLQGLRMEEASLNAQYEEALAELMDFIEEELARCTAIAASDAAPGPEMQALQAQAAEMENQRRSLEIQMKIAELNIQLVQLGQGDMSLEEAQAAQTALVVQQAEIDVQLAELTEAMEALAVTQRAAAEAQIAELCSVRSRYIKEVTASAKGFQSFVTATLTVGRDGIVTSLEIDSSRETPGFGTRMMEEREFIEQFVGISGPFVIGENVDALTGATVSSRAAVEAINLAWQEAVGSLHGSGIAEETPVEESPAESAAPLTASATGFAGEPVHVTVTLKADGTIATLAIDVSEQIPPICDLVLEDSFISQFIGKTGPFILDENIDGVTGATFTTRGVVDALNSIPELNP